MIPTTKNFILYDENRKIIPLPAEYYGDAIKRYIDGSEKNIELTSSQLNDLTLGKALSDSNIIPLAKYGLVAESIYIPSTTREVIQNQGVLSKSSVQRHSKMTRDNIEVTFKLYARDFNDFGLKISRYRAFLNNLGKFYVADVREPFKLYKVMINEAINFEQPQYRVPFGECTLSLIKVDSIFAESLHTTLDIESEGVRWNDKWGYGMGLSSDSGEWKYSFDTDAGQSYDFKFLNAGTEAVKLIQQKESRIRVEFKVAGSWFEISDGTTTFRLNKPYVKGDVLVIRGSKIFFNGQSVLQDTNRNFLTVKQGMNTWQTRGPKYYDFSIDFRFLYD